MSGIVKGVKKVFKKVTKFIKRYWKEIIIAAAIVFTAGAAMGAWGAAAGAGGATAGGVAAGAAGATAAGTATAGAAAAGAAAGGTVFGAAGGAAALGAGAGGALGMGGLAAGGAFGAGAGGAFAGLAAGGAAVGGAAAAAGGALAAGGAGGVTTLAPVVVQGVAPAAGGGVSLAQTVGAATVATGGQAAYSNAAAEVSPKNMDLATPAQTAAKGPMGKIAQGAKNMWGGLSSFEKVQLLATGVNMLSAATAKDQEVPLAHQFYGRDKDGKGAGIGFDYNEAAGKMVPADTRFLAKPEVGSPVSTQASGKSTVPDPFVQAPPRSAPKTQSFVPDNNDDLKKRMDFVQKGYESGDYSGGTG